MTIIHAILAVGIIHVIAVIYLFHLDKKEQARYKDLSKALRNHFEDSEES